MYTLRCCPMSFGIVCREVYDPLKHQEEDVVTDPFDGKRWAERQINWIITQVSAFQLHLLCHCTMID